MTRRWYRRRRLLWAGVLLGLVVIVAVLSSSTPRFESTTNWCRLLATAARNGRRTRCSASPAAQESPPILAVATALVHAAPALAAPS